jgi:hypothetical protein
MRSDTNPNYVLILVNRTTGGAGLKISRFAASNPVEDAPDLPLPLSISSDIQFN